MTSEFPPEAICAEEGCDEPMAGVAPSRRDLVLEDIDGQAVTRLAAGEYDEGFCTTHLKGPTDA